MKIIEAMKELKLIEKKIARNIESIKKYAAQTSNERPYFSTNEAQSKEIRSLVQANQDLIKNYLDIKGRIEKSNLSIKIEMDGVEYSLSELLVLKRKLAQNMVETYNAMNDHTVKSSMTLLRTMDKDIKIERFYDEREKMAGLRKWQDFIDNIDSRLEVINATTELM